jgi:uncharacterized membrane protein (DUF4010 family)
LFGIFLLEHAEFMPNYKNFQLTFTGRVLSTHSYPRIFIVLMVVSQTLSQSSFLMSPVLVLFVVVPFVVFLMRCTQRDDDEQKQENQFQMHFFLKFEN